MVHWVILGDFIDEMLSHSHWAIQKMQALVGPAYEILRITNEIIEDPTRRWAIQARQISEDLTRCFARGPANH